MTATIREQLATQRRVLVRELRDAERVLDSRVRATTHSIGKRNYLACAALLTRAWLTRNQVRDRLSLVS